MLIVVGLSSCTDMGGCIEIVIKCVKIHLFRNFILYNSLLNIYLNSLLKHLPKTFTAESC